MELTGASASPSPEQASAPSLPVLPPFRTENRSLHATAAEIVARVHVAFDSDSTSILLLDETGENLRILAHKGLPEIVDDNFRVPVKASISGVAVRERQPLLLNGDLKGTPLEPLARRPDLGSAISIPILGHQQRVIGVLNIGRLLGKPFYTEEHATMLELLAQQVGKILESAPVLQRLGEEPTERAPHEPAELRALADARPAVADIQRFLHQITGSSLTFLCLLTPSQEAAHLHIASHGALSPNSESLLASVAQLVHESLGVSLPPKAFHIHWSPEPPAASSSSSQVSPSQIVAAPLILTNALRGLLGWVAESPPSQTDYGRLRYALATAVSRELQNALDLAWARRRLAESALLCQLTNQLAGSLKLDELLELVRQAALKAVPQAEQAWVSLIDDGIEHTYPAGGLGHPQGQNPPWLSRLMDSALWRGEVILYTNTQGDSSAPFGTILVAPMVIRDRPLGALSIASRQPTAFEPSDRRLLSELARQAAVAVENAQLYGELDRQKQHMEAIIHNMADGLVVFDSSGRITSLNPAAERMLGLKESEVLGWSPADGEKDARFASLLRICQAGEPAGERIQHPALLDTPEPDNQPEITVDTPSPRVLRVLSSQIQPLGDEPGGEIKVLHDITREHELDRLQSDFISTVSHELRTPLFSIKGFIDLILKDKVPDPAVQREFLTRVAEQTKQLTALVNDLLDTSRLEMGCIDLAIARLDLVQIVREALAKLETIAHSREVSLRFEPRDAPLIVSGDARRLEQVVTNLVSNACKFSHPGGYVTVRCEADKGEAIVRVIDQGIGIPPEAIPRLFNKFYQVDSSATRRAGGTGLGLYISRRIVEAHGGRITVESQLGQGSVFSFAIPLKDKEE